jgi:hypothetical protein
MLRLCVEREAGAASPAGSMLTAVNVYAIIHLDAQWRITCRFTNSRNDEIYVEIRVAG